MTVLRYPQVRIFTGDVLAQYLSSPKLRHHRVQFAILIWRVPRAELIQKAVTLINVYVKNKDINHVILDYVVKRTH